MPEMVAQAKSIIYDKDSFETFNDLRRTKTYRGYPTSSTDEDRLIMTLFKYRLMRWQPKTSWDDDPDKAMEEFRQMIREELWFYI